MTDILTYFSPYRILAELELCKCYSGLKKGISPHRLAYLSKTLELSEISEYIIKCLYEFTYLTSHLIALCFNHPAVEPQLRKFRNDGKNPYTSELNYLIRIGAIQKISLHTVPEGEKKGYYIYTLTPGAWQWADDRFQVSRRFLPKGRRDGLYFNFPNHITYPELIEKLSFNQFHLSMLIHHPVLFTDINFCRQELIAGSPYIAVRYSLSEKTDIFFCSYRHPSYLAKYDPAEAMTALIDQFEMESQIILVIIGVDSLESAFDLFWQLKSTDFPYLQCLAFCSDRMTQNAADPMSSLIHITDTNGYDYEIGEYLILEETFIP